MKKSDFRTEYARQIDEWEAQVYSLNDVCDEWNREQNPAPYLQRFEQEYRDVLVFLKVVVKPFLAEHSAGYSEKDVNAIYESLLELSQAIQRDFLNEYNSMVLEYEKFLNE